MKFSKHFFNIHKIYQTFVSSNRHTIQSQQAYFCFFCFLFSFFFLIITNIICKYIIFSGKILIHTFNFIYHHSDVREAAVEQRRKTEKYLPDWVINLRILLENWIFSLKEKNPKPLKIPIALASLLSQLAPEEHVWTLTSVF